MYRILTFIIIVLFLHSCTSPEKLIKEELYDPAINHLAKDLKKDTENEKNISLLNTAYSIANKRDLDSIFKLRRSGKPDIWYDVYRIYNRLKDRQEIVGSLPPQILTEINYKKASFEKDIEQSRINAITFFYAHAKTLLNEGSRKNARIAYNELYKISEISKGYKDTESLMRYALLKGTSYVLLEVENKTGYPIPPSIVQTIRGINLTEYESKFLAFDVQRKRGREYAYTINVGLERILVSPLRTKKSTYSLSRKIPSEHRGTRDIVNSDGDTIRSAQTEVSEEKIVSCQVTDYIQEKRAIISGWVNFVEDDEKISIYETPLRAETVYKNVYSRIEGDRRACNPRILNRINNGDLPSPDDDAMVIDAALKFRSLLKQTLWDEDYLLK